MAKIPFSISYRPQIESGEYKVETRDGKPVRVVCWDREDECEQPIIALVQYNPSRENMISVHVNGVYDGSYGHEYDLFIITPEQELSEFELKVQEILYADKQEYSASDPESWKRVSSELLDLAKKELVDDMQLQFDDEINEAYYRGRKEGKAEALNDLPKWKKVNGEYYIPFSDIEKLPKED